MKEFLKSKLHNYGFAFIRRWFLTVLGVTDYIVTLYSNLITFVSSNICNLLHSLHCYLGFPGSDISSQLTETKRWLIKNKKG